MKSRHLVVTAPFSRKVTEGEGEAATTTIESFERGQTIKDPADVKAIRLSHPGNVVAIAADHHKDAEAEAAKAAAPADLTASRTASNKT